MKIPEDACLNCRFWAPTKKRDGHCRVRAGKASTDASGICLLHRRVSEKVEAERHVLVKDDDDGIC